VNCSSYWTEPPKDSVRPSSMTPAVRAERAAPGLRCGFPRRTRRPRSRRVAPAPTSKGSERPEIAISPLAAPYLSLFEPVSFISVTGPHRRGGLSARSPRKECDRGHDRAATLRADTRLMDFIYFILLFSPMPYHLPYARIDIDLLYLRRIVLFLFLFYVHCVGTDKRAYIAIRYNFRPIRIHYINNAYEL